MHVREIEVRYKDTSLNHDGRVPIREPRQAARVLSDWIGDACEERFCTILVDARHKPIAISEVSRGTLTASLVHPREVFKAAIAANAAGIIVGHNHPSGDSSPSSEDIEIAARLERCGEFLGIRVLDFLVVTSDGYWARSESESSNN